MPDTPILILSSRADAYRVLLEEALRGIPLLATNDPQQAVAQGAECEIVLGDPGLLRHVLHRLPRLRWVQSTWAGVDALMQAGLRRDYVLTNVRGVFGPPIAEYVLGYVLMHERRGWQRWRAQQEGRWDPTPPGSLGGKVMGILGVGSIGAHLARTVLPFGVRPLGYTRESEGCDAIARYYHGAELHAFAGACDYVVCTLPDTADSRHVVDAPFLAAMRPHALLINVGRGSAVDEGALVSALAEGQIGGGGAGRAAGGAAAFRPPAVAGAQRDHHLAHSRAELSRTDCAALCGELRLVDGRAAAAAPGKLCTRVLRAPTKRVSRGTRQ
jgi:phosphoglycerate dehydrogenase-like enzyme